MSATESVKTCYVLVLAPEVTSAPAAQHYQPFQQQPLREIFEKAAKNARKNAGNHGGLMYDRYEVSEAFFVGHSFTPSIAMTLRNLPSAILDCALAADHSALDEIQEALLAFNQPIAAKVVHKISRNGTCSTFPYPGPTFTSETIFLAVLENQLWSHRFQSVADQHPR